MIATMQATPRNVSDEITSTIAANHVVLFMKGSPQYPLCGFSAAAAKMLADAGVSDYAYVNVLEDNLIREGIKHYSAWPTIPQLYVNQEFIGGADIMHELQQTGELTRLLASK